MIHRTVRIGTVLRAIQLILPPPDKTSTREERCYARQFHGMPPTCARCAELAMAARIHN